MYLLAGQGKTICTPFALICIGEGVQAVTGVYFAAKRNAMTRNAIYLAVLASAILLTAFALGDGAAETPQPSADKLDTESAFASLVPLPLFHGIMREGPDFDFVYSIGLRMGQTITKADLDTARTVHDVVNFDHPDRITAYPHVVLRDFREYRRDWATGVTSQGEMLTVDQLEFLQDLRYGQAFMMEGDLMRHNGIGGPSLDDTLICYKTVVPEHLAKYRDGEEALIDYLKAGSREHIAIARSQLAEPGKVHCTVTPDGGIGQVWLGRTCGYGSIDSRMVELIKELPGAWQPARNRAGEAVEMELVFFFGQMGC